MQREGGRDVHLCVLGCSTTNSTRRSNNLLFTHLRRLAWCCKPQVQCESAIGSTLLTVHEDMYVRTSIGQLCMYISRLGSIKHRLVSKFDAN